MNKIGKDDYSAKKATLYSLAGFTDVTLFQLFTFLIFTFYFTVVGLNINYITIAFIIWSFWNAINDPYLGTLSDKTSSKWGRRKPFIIAGIYPLLLINILLWTPPIAGSQFIIFIYFLLIIIIWEFFYTMWSVNQTALFPEMFKDHEERTKANTIIQFFQILSLMIAFILPSFFIPQYDNPQYYPNYMYAGIAISIICGISATIFIKYGIKERIEFSKDPEQAPSFFNSLKYTFKNKAFRPYIVATFSLWYAFGMLPTISPLYGSFVLGIKDSLILSLLLALVFISAAIFVFVWKPVIRKFGPKKAFILVIIAFIITLIPFMFISDMISAFIAYFCLGIGIAGALIIRDVSISPIMDEDELNTGVRREGGFYGINGFCVKLTNVAVFLSIAIVFNSVGWAIFDPTGTTQETILGLRILMFVFPTIFLVIGLIAITKYPITKERYEEITLETIKLHEKKKEKIFKN
ncbi:MAG: MFS transporter [Promethearchaeota archaeon]|nr:MAG: MFS transporter [Candidatus Lokiarchaeota archaeon]